MGGGALLHRIHWKLGVPYKIVIQQYVIYVQQHYGIATIVFDGYRQGPSTKDAEHARRAKRVSAQISISPEVIVHGSQHAILSNKFNKAQFIDMLMVALRHEGHDVYQSTTDADNMIAQKALESASNGMPTIVESDDTDVLVLLIHHFNEEMSNIFFRSELSKRSRSGIRFYSISEIVRSIGSIVTRHILFIHAWSGCDTTSATFGQGKGVILKKMESSEELQSLSEIFMCESATPEDISSAGERIFVIMYSGKNEETLNSLRYTRYLNLLATSKRTLRPEMLPPTDRAAHYHSLRVHLQILKWKDLNDIRNDQAIDWGWKREKSHLMPVMTDKEPAPSDILKIIRCRCKRSCTTMCSCKKNGLKCVKACLNCQGESCDNIECDMDDNFLNVTSWMKNWTVKTTQTKFIDAETFLRRSISEKSLAFMNLVG